MKAIVLSVFMLAMGVMSSWAQTTSGKEIFAGNCKACHSIGGGAVVGPDLAGITERRKVEWIKSFISNSQKMVADGDELAVEVFNKFHKIAMPSHNFSDNELNSLISYMEEAGAEASAAKETEQVKVAATSAETPEKSMASVGHSSGMSWQIKTILGLLSISAIILTITAGYLYSFLKG